jgi:hypothetical protein
MRGRPVFPCLRSGLDERGSHASPTRERGNSYGMEKRTQRGNEIAPLFGPRVFRTCAVESGMDCLCKIQLSYVIAGSSFEE